VFLHDGFTAEGEVRLVGATIGGSLSCVGGSFTNPNGHALNAENVKVTGHVLLGDGFTADGELSLSGATIGGQLECVGGSFTNPGGYGLNAENVEVTASVFLRDGFTAKGQVNLSGTTIGGHLDCAGGRFTAPGRFGLRLEEAPITGAMIWLPAALAPSTGIDLTAASVGLLQDDITKWPNDGMLLLDRFKYTGFTQERDNPDLGANVGVKRRIAWIESTESFHSQPYEKLAEVYRSVGKTSEARRVGIAREKRRTNDLSWWRQLFHRLWGGFTAYGYRPAQSLWIFAAILIFAGFFYLWAGNSGVMEPTDLNMEASAIDCTDQYPCYQPLIYAADVMIPIVNLGQRDAWTPDVALKGDNSDVEYWPWAVDGVRVQWVTVLLVATGWALSAAFIASLGTTISRP
jgi:hypothetical protein